MLLQHMPAFVFVLIDFKGKNKTGKSCATVSGYKNTRQK
jgi:hypothetical protein